MQNLEATYYLTQLLFALFALGYYYNLCRFKHHELWCGAHKVANMTEPVFEDNEISIDSTSCECTYRDEGNCNGTRILDKLNTRIGG